MNSTDEQHPVTQSASEDTIEIDSALSRLEMCLESPVVPGELASWAAAVQHAMNEVEVSLRREINDGHPDQFVQISDDEPELLRQVEMLREEDSQLIARYDEFARQVSRFCERAEHAEPHESKLDEQVSAVVDDGLALVIRIRKQQQAISTWLLEAFQRDTGVAG